MTPHAAIAAGPSRLRAALHPLDVPPTGSGWNRAELIGLLSDDVVLHEAAVLVGLVPRRRGWQVLLTRRNQALRHHAGQVSFPGGRVEPGDLDVVAAAIRETVEETGLGPALIEPIGLLDPLCTITGFRVVPVVAMIDPGYVARPDPGEVEEVFEASLAFLLDPANLASVEVEFGGRPRRVLEFVDRGDPSRDDPSRGDPSRGDPRRRIWGATASILFNLRERLTAAG